MAIAKYNNEIFIDKAINKHGKLYTYNKLVYVNSVTKVIITCPIHGDFEQEPRIHLSGHGCIKCVNEKFSRTYRKTFDEFLTEARIRFGNKFEYERESYIYNPTTKRTRVNVICKYHGKRNQRTDQHLSKDSYGCYWCAANETKDKLRLTRNNFILRSDQAHFNKYDYSKMVFVDMYTPVKLICPVHGEITQDPKIHIRGYGCPNCVSSKGEIRVSNLLKYNDVNFIKEYRFPGYKYRYDFYIPELDTLIEYDGALHFKAVERFGGEDTLSRIRERDSIKNNIAIKHKLRLIRIHYKFLSRVEKELVTLLNQRVMYKKDNLIFLGFVKFSKYFNLPGSAMPQDYKQYLFKFKCPV